MEIYINKFECLKKKNIGVHSHFLLQGMFLTQKLKQSLLYLWHCWQILNP